MRLCVVDSSFALAWVFEDEANAAADALLSRLEVQDTMVVPAVLWSLDVRNALRSAVKRGRLLPEHAEQRRLALEAVPRVTVRCPHGLGDRIDALMRTHDLTSYDAAYLAITIEQGLPLATADARLAEAARREGVPSLRDALGPDFAER